MTHETEEVGWDHGCANCGHPMRTHALDCGLDPEVKCTVQGCPCPDFVPVH